MYDHFFLALTFVFKRWVVLRLKALTFVCVISIVIFVVADVSLVVVVVVVVELVFCFEVLYILVTLMFIIRSSRCAKGFIYSCCFCCLSSQVQNQQQQQYLKHHYAMYYHFHLFFLGNSKNDQVLNALYFLSF